MKTLYEGTFTRGYTTAFSQEVDKLLRLHTSVGIKNRLIEGITDAYFDQTGKLPDNYELERLGTWVLHDNVNDPDKVTNTEYPVLSHGQMKLRHRRELVSDTISDSSSSTKHKLNGKRKPKNFKVFGEYEGGY